MSDEACVDCEPVLPRKTSGIVSNAAEPAQEVSTAVTGSEPKAQDNTATISPPTPKDPSIIIEYCDRVRLV